jgi:hypothetical protein
MERSSADKSRWNGFVREKWGGWRKAYSSGGTRDGSSCSIIDDVVVIKYFDSVVAHVKKLARRGLHYYYCNLKGFG